MNIRILKIPHVLFVTDYRPGWRDELRTFSKLAARFGRVISDNAASGYVRVWCESQGVAQLLKERAEKLDLDVEMSVYEEPEHESIPQPGSW